MVLDAGFEVGMTIFDMERQTARLARTPPEKKYLHPRTRRCIAYQQQRALTLAALSIYIDYISLRRISITHSRAWFWRFLDWCVTQYRVFALRCVPRLCVPGSCWNACAVRTGVHGVIDSRSAVMPTARSAGRKAMAITS